MSATLAIAAYPRLSCGVCLICASCDNLPVLVMVFSSVCSSYWNITCRLLSLSIGIFQNPAANMTVALDERFRYFRLLASAVCISEPDRATDGLLLENRYATAETDDFRRYNAQLCLRLGLCGADVQLSRCGLTATGGGLENDSIISNLFFLDEAPKPRNLKPPK